MEKYGWADDGGTMDDSDADEMQCDNLFGIHPFYIEKGSYNINLFLQLNVCWLSFLITLYYFFVWGKVVAWWVVYLVVLTNNIVWNCWCKEGHMRFSRKEGSNLSGNHLVSLFFRNECFPRLIFCDAKHD